MNSQQLEYVRQQLIVATADLSGATKGQLVAFAENAQFTATARSRGRKKVFDKDKQRMVNPDGPPMSGSQSRAKGSSIALVGPVEFVTASWRRAVLSLEDHQKAWLLWNYSENIRFEHQVAITQWAWAEFREQLGTKKLASKTMERLKNLIWLAAQDVKAELSGRETYEYQALAELAGVAKSTWTETYLPHWLLMRTTFKRLDSGALISVTRSRSQQKATNLDVSLAKPN
ncbi:bacteriophage antitermination protein Q [Enterobacter hormaechei]|uniref:bacteriophage antitermination protein Q n=1 Tax=Enterobacter hormaechei TaxID=158836 RepID=UPI000649E34D|nr:bacteriophage antitermination protein Q [Enterobacter hormaechei]KLR40043.1 antiterminator [Enterobacter hormaechei subsp. steigerwaltii]MCM7629835.1 bacteriophage antitermination protein Q [Enterobacter hormaechei]HCR1883537.1 antiterminator [Enterobacter hormaechei subsp. steigerwaltii]HCT4613630.1 antiterminator [Enterobacter hormaechei]